MICEGKLDPERLAGDYVPEFAGSAYFDASVRQLLDMAVGISYTERYDDPASESSQFGYACGFQPAPVEYAQYASLYQYLPSLRKRGEHGGLFHYVTATTEALAWVMERACGEACHELLARISSRSWSLRVVRLATSSLSSGTDSAFRRSSAAWDRSWTTTRKPSSAMTTLNVSRLAVRRIRVLPTAGRGRCAG